MLKFSDYQKSRNATQKPKGREENEVLSFSEFTQARDAEHWFNKTGSLLSELSSERETSTPSYGLSKKAYSYNKALTELNNQSSYIKSYIDSLKDSAPEQYSALSEQFNGYRNGITSMLDYTKGLSDFASQFDNEEDYNQGIKEIKTANKYSGLKSYSDYMNAIREADNPEDKEWLVKNFTGKKNEKTTGNLYDTYLASLNSAPNSEVKDTLMSQALSLGTSDEIKRYISDREFSGEATEEELKSLYRALNEREKWENSDEGKRGRAYYDLSPYERNDIAQYTKIQNGETVDYKSSPEDKEKDKNRLLGSSNPIVEQMNINGEKAEGVVSRVQAIADRLGMTAEELVKWYQRGEANDVANYENAKTADYAKENPLQASFQSIIEKPFRDLVSVGQYIGALGNEDHYIDTSTLDNSRTNTIRQTVSDSIDNPIGKFFYDSGMSTADSAWNMILGGAIGGTAASRAGETGLMLSDKIGNAVTLTPAFTGAATDAANRVLENGGSYENAMLTGLASGIAEVLFEKVSLEQLKGFAAKNPTSLKGIMTNVAKGMFTEGSEEVATDIANLITDNLINGGLSELNLNRQHYLDEGDDESTAWWKSLSDFGLQLVESFAGGAMGGALFSGGASGLGYVGNYAQNSKIGNDILSSGGTQDIADIGSTYSEGSDSAQLAARLRKQLAKDKVRPQTLGRTYSKIIDDSIDNASGEIKARLADVLNNSEFTRAENKIVEKLIKGTKLSESEETQFNKSSALQDLAAQIDDISETLADNVARAYGATLPSVKANVPENLNLEQPEMNDGTRAQALVAYADAHNLNADTRDAMIKNYDGTSNVDTYAREFIAYNNYGRLGYNQAAIPDNLYSLTDNARAAAYNSGAIEAETNLKARSVLSKAQQRIRNQNNGFRKGTVNMSAIENIRLTENQKDSVDYVNKAAEYSGFNVEWFKSEADAEGNVITPENGSYNSATNTIRLDINAGQNNIRQALTQGAIISTFSHELTHIAENAPDEYLALRKAVVKVLGNKAWQNAVDKQSIKLKENHPENTSNMTDKELEEYAATEALAEYCSNLLKDSDLVEQLARENPSLKAKLKKLLDKVISAIRSLRDRIRENYGATNAYTAELDLKLHKLNKARTDILSKWEAAVKEGIKTQNARTAAPESNKKGSSQNVKEHARNNTSFNEYAVSSAIWEALDHMDSGNDNLIKVGKIPNYINSLLGITGDFYIQRNHTYENTVSEEQAKNDGRYNKRAHYHNYGVEGMTEAMMSIEHPIMTIATKTNDGNPTVILILDKFGNNGAPLYAVLSFYSNKLINGQNVIKPHVILTIAERQWHSKNGRVGFDEIINNAINNKRVIDFDKNKRGDLSEVAQTTSLSSITVSSLKHNLTQFKKEINSYKEKNNISYQDRNTAQLDNDYLSAVNRGDLKTAQRMVDEAAEIAFADSTIRDDEGKLLKVYHGTDADFTVFDRTKGRSGADIQGMFFSPWDIDAQGYGSNLRAFYLNIKNPASETEGYKALRKFAKENYRGIKAREELEQLGHDGVNNSDEEYIAFYSEQIKSADPVTYDDNGEVIPLSQRFNENNPDIRYQDRGNGYSGYSMSNNAVAAYEDGEMPLSKWSKSAILNAIAQIDEGKAEMLKGLKLSVLRNKVLYNSSWHHTSSMYNKTEFYAVDEDVIENLNEDTVKSWAQTEQKASKPKSNTYRGDFDYITWEGSRRYPKAVKHTLKDVNIEERGQFYYVTNDSGELIVKKKIGSNGTYARRTGTKFQDRDGGSESELLANSPITDRVFDFNDFDLSGDLFDNESEEERIRFDKMLKDDPVEAMRAVMKSGVATATEAIKGGIELDNKALAFISNKVANDYMIDKSAKSRIGEIINEYVKAINSGEDSVTAFEEFFSKARDIALEVNIESEQVKERRAQIKSVLKNTILDVTDRQLPDIISRYDSYANFRKTMQSYGLRVRQESNAKRDIYGRTKGGSTVNDIIISLNQELGYDIYNGVNGVTNAMDDSDGIIELEEFLSREMESEYYNPYLAGEAENLDLAAAELAFDAMKEYIYRQGLASTGKGKSSLVKKYNTLKEKSSKQYSKLKAAEKSLLNEKSKLNRLRSDIESLNKDYRQLSELDKQLTAAESELVVDDDKIEELWIQRQAAAERYEKASKALNRRTRGMSTMLKNAKKEAVKAEQAKWEGKLKKVREEKNAKINALIKDRQRAINEAAVEYRDARTLTEVVNRIKKLGERMGRMLTKPNNKLYVPSAFRDTFLDVCNSFIESMETDKDTEVGRKLSDLKNLLAAMNEGSQDYSEYKDEFSPEVFKALDKAAALLREKLEGKTISRDSLTLDEANDIYSLLTTVYETVRDATVQLGEREGMTNVASGERISAEMVTLENEGYNKNAAIKRAKAFALNAVRAARMYTGYKSNSELMYHINELERGTRKANYYTMEAEKLFTDLTEGSKENQKAYDRSLHEVIEVEYSEYNGEKKKVKLTRMVGLQVLMSWQREMQDKHLKHMTKGGIKLPNAEYLAKGNLAKALDNPVIIRKVNPSLIIAIESKMTDFEQKYRAAAESYFNKLSKARINEVGNVLKHRDIATSDYYIPFTVNGDELVKELDNIKYDHSLENMGMLKTLQYHAPQNILITGLNNVIARHISDTAKLYGLAVPIRNFKKALNVQFRSEFDGEMYPSGSVRTSIEKVWGKKGNAFFNQIITDLQTPREKTADLDKFLSNAVEKLREATIIKTLTGNISVTIKQAASYPTAGLYLSAKSMAKGLAGIKDIIGGGKYQALFDEIDSHTAQHYMRRKGLSIPELNDIANSFASKVAKKAPTAVNPSKWIQGVDVFTTAMLWKAARAEVDSKYKKNGKEPNSREYWDDVTSLYDRIVEDTQPMYDVLHRAEAQKTTSQVWRFAFMFKTQPLQNTGIIYDAWGEMRANPNSHTRKAFAKAIASQTSSLAVFAAMTLAAGVALHKVKRYKDEDDEVTFWSAFTTALGDMAANGAAVLIPIGGSELTEAISNVVRHKNVYDLVSVPAVDMVNDTKDSIVKFYKTLDTQYNRMRLGVPADTNALGEAFGSTAGDIAGIFGVPTGNIYNIGNSAVEYFNDIMNGTNVFESKGGRSGKEYVTSYGNNLLKGNTEKAKQQLNTMYVEKYNANIAKGEEQEESRKKAFGAVRTALSNTYKPEYQEAVIRKDESRMDEIKTILQSSGYMIYDKKSLNDVLLEWRENALEDVLSKFK